MQACCASTPLKIMWLRSHFSTFVNGNVTEQIPRHPENKMDCHYHFSLSLWPVMLSQNKIKWVWHDLLFRKPCWCFTEPTLFQVIKIWLITSSGVFPGNPVTKSNFSIFLIIYKCLIFPKLFSFYTYRVLTILQRHLLCFLMDSSFPSACDFHI